MLRNCVAFRVVVERVRNLGGIRFRRLWFSVARPERMFWQLLPAPVIGGQVYSTSTDEWAERTFFSMKKNGSEGHNKQCSPQRKNNERKDPGTVLDDLRDEFDLTNSIQTKAAFSDALAIMDRVGGWRFGHEKGSQIGTIFAACMWVHTKAVICNGQRHMETFRINKRNSITEAASWVLCPLFRQTTIGSRNFLWYCRKPTFWRH